MCQWQGQWVWKCIKEIIFWYQGKTNTRTLIFLYSLLLNMYRKPAIHKSFHDPAIIIPSSGGKGFILGLCYLKKDTLRKVIWLKLAQIFRRLPCLGLKIFFNNFKTYLLSLTLVHSKHRPGYHAQLHDLEKDSKHASRQPLPCKTRNGLINKKFRWNINTTSILGGNEWCE